MRSQLDSHFGISRSGVRANGCKIRELRILRGWTQLQLASKSGYSERVIRKAESSEPISLGTLRTISEALSTSAQKIAPQDILLDPSTLVEQLLAAVELVETPDLSSFQSLLDENITVLVHGDQRIPHSGTCTGIAKATHIIQHYLQSTSPPGSDVLRECVPTAGNRVLLKQSVMNPEDGTCRYWVLYYFTCTSSVISQIDIYCDTAFAAGL